MIDKGLVNEKVQHLFASESGLKSLSSLKWGMVLVAIGATMVLGADGAIVERTVALASAGDELAGPAGLAAMTLAAAFATAAAINSTLFSTAKLAERVADDAELPDPAERFRGRGHGLRLLVIGGSLGARVLNRTVPEAVARLHGELPVKVHHQTGAAEEPEPECD